MEGSEGLYISSDSLIWYWKCVSKGWGHCRCSARRLSSAWVVSRQMITSNELLVKSRTPIYRSDNAVRMRTSIEISCKYGSSVTGSEPMAIQPIGVSGLRMDCSGDWNAKWCGQQSRYWSHSLANLRVQSQTNSHCPSILIADQLFFTPFGLTFGSQTAIKY